MRLGHALKNEQSQSGAALEDAVRIARGDFMLLPRDPMNPAVVSAAEHELGVDAAERPVYAYIGALHDDLGTVAVIIENSWMDRELHGVSKCDSGGLAGGIGAFGQVEDRLDALREVSFSDGRWKDLFGHEITSSYPAPRDYVSGVLPETAHWDDFRKDLVNSGVDRRVWTWEARCRSGPLPEEVSHIVLSIEERINLEFLRREQGIEPPPHVKVIYSMADTDGVYNDPHVHDALVGV